MTANNLKQAYVFERGEVLPNANGTAPGLWVEQDGKVLCMLPGPPNELQPMFTEQVLPRLAERGLLLEREAYVQIRTAGVGESRWRRSCSRSSIAWRALSIAFCAHQGQVDCRVSSPSGELSVGARDCRRVCDLLGDDFVCYGQDSLARVCADLLRARRRSSRWRRRRPAVCWRMRSPKFAARGNFRGRVRVLFERREDAESGVWRKGGEKKN